MLEGCARPPRHDPDNSHAPPVFHLNMLPCVMCVCRLLAEEDDAAGPGPVSQAAGEEGQELYQPGAVEAEGFKGKFNQYLIRKVSRRQAGWLAGPIHWQLL